MDGRSGPGAVEGRYRTSETVENCATDGELAAFGHLWGNLPHLQLEALMGDRQFKLLAFHFGISHRRSYDNEALGALSVLDAKGG